MAPSTGISGGCLGIALLSTLKYSSISICSKKGIHFTQRPRPRPSTFPVQVLLITELRYATSMSQALALVRLGV